MRVGRHDQTAHGVPARGAETDRAPILVRRSQTTTPGEATTPGGATPEGRRGLRPSARTAAWLAAGLLAVVTAAALTATGPISGPGRSPSVPAAEPARSAQQTQRADVDGDGIREDVTIDGATIVVASGPQAGRYDLGETAGRVLVADLDCDGIATPVVHRPAAGRLYVYAQWPDPDPVAPRVIEVPVDEPLDSRRGSGCDQLEIAGRRVR